MDKRRKMYRIIALTIVGCMVAAVGYAAFMLHAPKATAPWLTAITKSTRGMTGEVSSVRFEFFRRQPTYTDSKETSSSTWNTGDVQAATNGNVVRAIRELNVGMEAHQEMIDIADVVNSPSAYYGRNLCFRGRVLRFHDLAPTNPLTRELGGVGGELLVQTASTYLIHALIKGSSGNLGFGSSVLLCGLATGRLDPAQSDDNQHTELLLVGELKPYS